CADEESNNKQVRSKTNAAAFIEASPAGASRAPAKRQGASGSLRQVVHKSLRALANDFACEDIHSLNLQKPQKGFIGQRRRDALSNRPPVGMRPDTQFVANEPPGGQNSPAISQGKGVKVIGHSS